jgi:hypothetical protein
MSARNVLYALRQAERITIMRVHQERQLNPVADEVLALTAIVRPILTGTLYALKQDLVANVGATRTSLWLCWRGSIEPATGIAESVLSTPFMKP